MRNEPGGNSESLDYARLDSDECNEIAGLLQSLYPDEWEAPSLCERWRVRDVVGHLISLGEVNPATVPISLIRHGFSTDRWLSELAIRRADGRTRGELILAWDLQLPSTGLTRFRTEPFMLYEHVVHHQDIRRPLRRPRQIPVQTLLALLGLGRSGARSERPGYGSMLLTSIGLTAKVRGCLAAQKQSYWPWLVVGLLSTSSRATDLPFSDPGSGAAAALAPGLVNAPSQRD